ncbi:hypothetical protein E3N88_31052 [Mikania micrantha]|uniref:Calmodulin-binding domain-containing protein n=1 Tax=Mikania micrantha TaxID=192012 RepID=A0A5N6MNW5_9ASTR|nr:hypothetical protein E3N88_31052 [Mikania micrantha]
MPTKGRDIIVKEKRGQSPLLPRRVEIGQQTRSLVLPTLDWKIALASTESKKIPIYDKHTVSSCLYALNTIKHSFTDNTKPVPQSKVTSIRSMFNEKKVTNSYMNPTCSAKTKDNKKPHIVHGKKSKNMVVDKTPRLFKDDQTIVTHEENEKTIALVNREDDDILTCEVEFRDGGEVSLCEHLIPTCDESISIDDQHVDDDHGNESSQQDQIDKISDRGSDGHQSRFEVGQEPEDEQGVQDEEMEPGPKPKEPDIKEGGEVVPKEEDRTSKMVVRNHVVVAHGKKDTAAYNNVTEVTLSELQQQRLNRVKALVGAFENVISLECNTLQKSIKQH